MTSRGGWLRCLTAVACAIGLGACVGSTSQSSDKSVEPSTSGSPAVAARALGAYAGSARVTNTTLVADPDRRYVYAASPDGWVHKLSVATGRQVRGGHWPARVTFDPGREKMDSPLGVTGHSVIATTGGYIGDAPVYQGHVVLIDRASG